jgi:HAD superfamily hydrolase (TIGR01509 family)
VSWKPIKCVVFDWGGVILKHHRSWADACGAAGVEVRAGHDAVELVVRRRALNQQFQAGLIGPEEFYPAMASATGDLYTPEEVRCVHDAWLTEEYPGVRGLIERLVMLPRVETGLLSNTNACHWERMKEFPTAGLLKHKHASHLLGHVKPSAEIYRAFERVTGFVGTDVLFFDDLQENINTAHSVGWHAELIDHTGDTAGQLAGHLARYEVF